MVEIDGVFPINKFVYFSWPLQIGSFDRVQIQFTISKDIKQSSLNTFRHLFYIFEVHLFFIKIEEQRFIFITLLTKGWVNLLVLVGICNKLLNIWAIQPFEIVDRPIWSPVDFPFD